MAFPPRIEESLFLAYRNGNLKQLQIYRKSTHITEKSAAAENVLCIALLDNGFGVFAVSCQRLTPMLQGLMTIQLHRVELFYGLFEVLNYETYDRTQVKMYMLFLYRIAGLFPCF
jgi:hypothetical protein